MKLIKKLTLDTNCPQCQQKIWKLVTKGQLTFCPHCHISVYPKKADKESTKQPMHKWRALVISITAGIILYSTAFFMDNPLVASILLVIAKFGLVIFLIWFFLLLLWSTILRNVAITKLQEGVDNLAQLNEDSCEYVTTAPHSDQGKVIQCPNCTSFRLVDTFWYKRILAKTESMINIKELNEGARFAGCLHCHKQYQIGRGASDIKLERKFVIGVAIFILIIFVFNDQFINLLLWCNEITLLIPYRVSLFWSCITSLSIYNTMVNAQFYDEVFCVKLRELK